MLVLLVPSHNVTVQTHVTGLCEHVLLDVVVSTQLHYFVLVHMVVSLLPCEHLSLSLHKQHPFSSKLDPVQLRLRNKSIQLRRSHEAASRHRFGLPQLVLPLNLPVLLVMLQPTYRLLQQLPRHRCVAVPHASQCQLPGRQPDRCRKTYLRSSSSLKSRGHVVRGISASKRCLLIAVHTCCTQRWPRGQLFRLYWMSAEMVMVKPHLQRTLLQSQQSG